MTIYYWTNFVKRKNSTLQPLIALATMVTDVHLKEGTSIEKPVFQLTGDLFTANYVRAFEHYYFVDDITSVRNNLVEISCSMDVLATFKADIADYTAMIERSDTFYDASYPDPAVSIKNDIVTDMNTASAQSFFSQTGFFVISVLNTLGSSVGFTTSYVIDDTNMKRLAAYVNTDWGSAANDILGWLQATFLKTAQSIIDCVWIPINESEVSGSSISIETVKIGVDAVSGCTGYRLVGPLVLSDSATINIPHYYSSGDFRRYAPYSTAKVLIPGFGSVEINPGDFEPSGTVKLGFVVDCCTGDTICMLTNNDDEMIATYNYNIGVSCPVGKVGSNVTGTATGILSTASSIAMSKIPGNRYAAMSEYAAASEGINTLASAFGVTPSVSGSKSGRAFTGLSMRVYCTCIAKKTESLNEMQTVSGRPCMQKHQLSTCSGYVKCIDAAVPIAGMSTEKDEVNTFLNSGFYYE